MTRYRKEILAKGGRIYLRRVVPDDVTEAYCSWLADPEVMQYLESRFSRNGRMDILKYVKRMYDDRFNLFMAIIVKDGNKHIGNIKIASINYNHRFADLSIIIGEKSEWGKGFAAEAIGLAVDIAFKKLKLHKLTSGCYSCNVASKKAFIKAGFVVEGVFKKQYFCNRKWVDRICMGIMNPDFKALKTS